MIIGDETVDSLIGLIRKIVREEVHTALKDANTDVETYRHCVVTDVQIVSSGNVQSVVSADVTVLGTGETMSSVPNKSGEELSVGDTVRIYETSGNYNNRYIGLKCS